ncbi:MAG TPA: hypothetical protein VML54_02360 [Candidatus Limnocylindrales bacterium]|nr:hypothetical protein [Candidatus Limnocylindrales bacterium]
MKRVFAMATIALALALGPGVALAPQSATATEQASEAVSGQVTKIDLERGRVTVRGSDGQMHEFEASPETIRDLQVGDHIEAKRRPATE